MSDTVEKRAQRVHDILKVENPDEICGEMVNNHFVGWMRSGDHLMFKMEQPDGGFKWSFIDFDPAKHSEYANYDYEKIYITTQVPEDVEALKSEIERLKAELAAYKEHCRC